MKKYDNYKDSGIEWIGKIPVDWVIKKLKFIAKIHNGQDQKAVLCDNGEYPVYGSGGIFGRANSYLYDKTSVLLGRKGTIDKPQYVEEPFWTVDTSYYTKINLGYSVRYFYYLCTTINFELYKYGSAIPSMTQGHLNEIKFALPNSLEGQEFLANYLDHKTNQIDHLIAKKEQFIKLLEEERVAVINQAVTKGLDPNVPMKDSGVEWLGEIPEHWKVKRLGFVFKSLNTKRIPLSGEERGQMETRIYDYYGASGVIDKVENFLFNEDLILIGEDGANLLTRSKRLVFIASGKYWVNNHAHIIKPISGDINYYCEFLELIDYTIYISGSAQPKLTQEALMSIKIVEPPLKEQQDIYDFIRLQTNNLDSIISKSKHEIELLKEYKTALISEVVTGKVDVR